MFEFVFGVDESTLFTDYIQKEEIVRCRDCTSFFVDKSSVSKCLTPCGTTLLGPIYTDPDGFCAWSTRRYDVED